MFHQQIVDLTLCEFPNFTQVVAARPEQTQMDGHKEQTAHDRPPCPAKFAAIAAGALSLRRIGAPCRSGELPSTFRRGSAVFDRSIVGNQEIALFVLPKRAA
jgi:hypothetical protein